MTIFELQEQLDALQAESESILAAADGEKRDHLTEDEQEKMDSLLSEIEMKKGDLARMHAVEANRESISGSAGRRTPASKPGTKLNLESDDVDDFDDQPLPQMRGGNPKPEYKPNVREDRGRWGWKSFGEFAGAVRMACVDGGTLHPLLARMAPSTYSSEKSGAEGGYAVPPDFRTAIMEKVMGEDSLISRTDQMTSSSNNFTFPKDETTPWGSSGVQAYWEGEAAQKAASKISLEQSTIRLNKLIALVPVTDELLEDAPALDTYLRNKAPERIDFKINLAIVQGSGAGQPLGILNSAATVSVAKESSQVADTIVANNIIKMYSRMYAPSRRNAVWLINQDIEPMLFTLFLEGKDNTGAAAAGTGSHVFMPAGGLSGNPYATLFGRPVIPTQATETLGDKGDIIFADLTKYMTITKSAGIRTDVSIHLYFDYDISTFRFVFRMGGQPWWTAPITPRDSNNTLSCFVTLDERA